MILPDFYIVKRIFFFFFNEIVPEIYIYIYIYLFICGKWLKKSEISLHCVKVNPDDLWCKNYKFSPRKKRSSRSYISNVCQGNVNIHSLVNNSMRSTEGWPRDLPTIHRNHWIVCTMYNFILDLLQMDLTPPLILVDRLAKITTLLWLTPFF